MPVVVIKTRKKDTTVPISTILILMAMTTQMMISRIVMKKKSLGFKLVRRDTRSMAHTWMKELNVNALIKTFELFKTSKHDHSFPRTMKLTLEQI